MTTRGFWMQGDSTTYTAAALRDLSNLWWPGSDGVLNSGGAMKVTAQGTPNMSVACADGWAKHTGYLGRNTASKNVTIATANASNPRIDLVVWRWQDQANGDAVDSGDFYVVQGTPSATPAVPATTGLTCEALAQVYVAAGTASIASAAITDMRTLVSLTADTLWVPITNINSSYTAGSPAPAYRVKNGIVWIRGTLVRTTGSVTAGETLVGLPSGTWSSAAHYWTAPTTGSAVFARLNMATSGIVAVSSVSGSVSTIFIDTAIPID